MTESRSTPAGIAAAIVAVVCWSAGNVMVVEAPMSGLQIAFWRIALGAAVFSAIVYVSGRRITAAMLLSLIHI